MPVTSTDVIERTIHIDAKPETVFEFLSDSDRFSSWAGRSTTMDPRPGGLFRIDYNGFDIMRGNFVEIVPPSRIVFTWGWETLGDQVRPGQSTVTVTLEPEGDGTRLRLLHEGLGQMDLQGHADGWDFFLSRLVDSVAGRDVGPFAPPLTDAEEYASRLNSLLYQAREVLEAMPDRSWKSMTSEQRATNALAQHMVDHLGLVDVALDVAHGNPSPVNEFTLETLNAGNAQTDRANKDVPRDAVLAALLAQGPQAVEKLKAFSDEELAGSMPMALSGGQPTAARVLIEGPVLNDIAAHLAHIRAAAG
ncbi:MAG: SRPBCC domain-containing protein [Dehalococcoidia bacterium]